MQRVIYADVLIVINIYITYFLLRATALLSKQEANRLRILLASFIGGIYSLTVLIPEEYQVLLGVLRIFAAVFFVLVAFGYTSLRAFIRLNVCFIFCSFMFAGAMLAVWYFICPGGMYFNGSVVYFDINIFTLVVLTVVCYAAVTVFDRLFKSRAPLNTVFMCKVIYLGAEYNIKAFLDTGNRLKDYFTDKPVIIAERQVFKAAFPNEITYKSDLQDKGIRFIFCDTVSGKSMLPAFSPESVHIKGADYDFISDCVTLALTENRIMQGEYDAILPMGLFKNLRKDECESEKNSVKV